MFNTNTHKSTVSHDRLKCLKSQFYQLILLKFYSILFNPARSAINCDDYEDGDVMISIIMNRLSQPFYNFLCSIKYCTNNRFDLCKSLYSWVMNTHTNHSAGLILPARAKIHLQWIKPVIPFSKVTSKEEDRSNDLHLYTKQNSSNILHFTRLAGLFDITLESGSFTDILSKNRSKIANW